MRVSLRKLSSFVFRRPSRIVREINSNALLLHWCKQNRAEHVFGNRVELYEFVESNVLEHQPIDYIEFGVYQGASLFKWAELNTHPRSRFYGFDTFEGLPETWDRIREPFVEGHFDTGGQTPHTDDGRVRFVKGLFQETLPGFLQEFEPQSQVVVHNDSDLYSSTLYCLTQCDRVLRPGSVLIFDEFSTSSHEFQAFYDYTRSYRRTFRVLGAVGSKPYVQIALRME